MSYGRVISAKQKKGGHFEERRKPVNARKGRASAKSTRDNSGKRKSDGAKRSAHGVQPVKSASAGKNKRRKRQKPEQPQSAASADDSGKQRCTSIPATNNDRDGTVHGSTTEPHETSIMMGVRLSALALLTGRMRSRDDDGPMHLIRLGLHPCRLARARTRLRPG
jgi:hypothetical protein